MTNDPQSCDYRGCEAPADVVRRTTPKKIRYQYCEDHDPLDDPDVADHWEEVTMDG